MGKGGKFSSKVNIRKRARSEEAGGSDDSDEDYVVSDDDNASSLDGFASEESYDSLIEEEDEEDFPRVRNFNRSKTTKGGCGRRKKTSITSRKRGRITYAEEEEDEEKETEEEEDEDKEEVQDYDEEEEEEKEKDEDEEDEFQGVRNFNTSKAKNGCGRKKIASKSSTKRGRIIHAEQLEEDEDEEDEDEKDEEEEEEEKDEEKDENYKVEEEEEEEEEKVETEGDEEEEEDLGDEWVAEEEVDLDEEDEEFDCDDDDEFTPDEDEFLDEEEEMRGRKKVPQKRASVVSTRSCKSWSSRASKKSSRSKRRRNVGLRSRVICDDGDNFIDNGPAIRTTSTRTRSQKRRRVLLSDSDRASPGASDFEYTVSEEEREQVREAKRLCGSSRINLRSSSPLLIENEEDGGLLEDVRRQRKPPGRKGKEKIEEPQGRKGKEKAEVLKSEVGKQVCGICLSEDDKRRVRGVLNCCTHYFCFVCIMEWGKVESRCPLCKQRFTTISKPARSTGIDLREVVIQVPERDQVYQPSEEELRSYIDPYEYVFCSECHQGGDDGLMLLCDICDSPAHTYCVGLGREVPEGNWYCYGCRPVALVSSNSQVEERVAEQRVMIQSLPVRPPAVHVRESIDLNSMSSPRAAFSQGFGHPPSSRFSGRSVEGASPVIGTLSERRWIHRQIQQFLSMDRMASTTGRTNAIIPATSTASNLYSTQIDQSSVMAAAEHAVAQDVGTSHHTFFEERLCNNPSPLMPLCNNPSPLMQNGAFWHGLEGTPPVFDCDQIHQFSRSSNTVAVGSLSPGASEESNFHVAKEQLQSMVISHLKSLSQNIDLGLNTFMDIARSCMNTILAACGLEQNKSEVCTVQPPLVCQHNESMAGGQTSLIKGCCSSCFDSFVGDVVKRILDTRISPQWLRLGL